MVDTLDICSMMGLVIRLDNAIASTRRLWPLFLQKMSKYKVEKSEQQWKDQLSVEEYRILRQAGTEYPFTGQYNNHLLQASTAVKAVVPHSTLLALNSTVAAAGRHMTKASRVPLSTARILPWVCDVSKFFVLTAAVTKGMSSTMAPPLRGNAIVLIPPVWILYPARRNDDDFVPLP